MTGRMHVQGKCMNDLFVGLQKGAPVDPRQMAAAATLFPGINPSSVPLFLYPDPNNGINGVNFGVPPPEGKAVFAYFQSAWLVFGLINQRDFLDPDGKNTKGATVGFPSVLFDFKYYPGEPYDPTQVDASYAMYVHDTMFVPGAIYPKNLTVEDARSVDHVTYARQAQDASRRHLPVGEGLITIVPPRTTMWLSKSKSKFDCGAGGPSAAKERFKIHYLQRGRVLFAATQNEKKDEEEQKGGNDNDTPPFDDDGLVVFVFDPSTRHGVMILFARDHACRDGRTREEHAKYLEDLKATILGGNAALFEGLFEQVVGCHAAEDMHAFCNRFKVAGSIPFETVVDDKNNYHVLPARDDDARSTRLMWVPREEIRREYTGWKEMRVEDVEHVLGPDLVRQAPNGPDVEEVLALAQRTAAQRTARPSYTLPGALYDPTTLAPTRFGEAVIGNAVTLRLDDNETDEDDEDNVPPPGYDNHDDPRREVDNTVQAHIDTIGDALERLDDKNDDPTPTPTTRLQQQVAAAVPHVLFRGKPDEDNDHLGDVGAHGLNVPTREQEQAKNKNLTHIVDAIRKVLHGLQREEDDDDAIRKVLLELQHEDDDDDDDKDLIANGGWETALAHLALCKRHEQDAAADEYMHDANAGADEYMHMFTDEWRPSVRAAAASLVALWKAHEDDDNMAAAKALVDHLGVCFLREVRAGVDREVVITHTASAVVAKTVDAIIAAWKKRDPSVLCALGQFVDMDEDMDDRKKMFRVHIDKPVLTDVENALKEHDRPAASLHGDAAAAMLGPGLVAGTPMHPAWTTPTKPALRFLARVLGYQASTSRSSSSPTLADKTVVCWTDPADGKTRCATSLANVFFTGGIDRQGHMAFRLLGKTTKDCDLIVICRLFVDPQTGGVGLRQISKGDHLDVRAWLPGNLESVLRRAVAEMLRARAAEAKARADEDEKDEDEEQKNDHAKEEVVLRYLFYPWQAERYLHDIEAGRAFMPLVDELFATIMRGEASRADALAVMKAASEPVSRKDAARKGLKRVLDMLLFLADRTDDVKDSRDVNARVLYALTEAGLFDPTKNTLLCLPWEHGARTRFNLAEWYTVVSETEITRAEALANEAVASARAIAEATAAARADVEEAMKDDDEEDKDEEDDEDDDEDDEEGTTRKRTRTGEDGESRRKRRKKDDDAPQQRQRQQQQQPAPGAPRKRRRP